MSGLPSTPESVTTTAVASRGKIVMMAIIAGAVITNIYCTQPILPLIAAGMRVDITMVDFVAGAALLGFSTGLALLLPLGDRFDRRKLVLAQIVLAFVFAAGAAVAPGIWALIAASFALGIVSCVPQQLVPFAAVMSLPSGFTSSSPPRHKEMLWWQPLAEMPMKGLHMKQAMMPNSRAT